ncbi:hypothetical protein TcWFU_006043 [Taenia crassiceps]|uniref:Uncharacterized protein n=1 Tax=Taenia crassiceps TaxID=6207 RepID=A0ABR4Q887_9CEST
MSSPTKSCENSAKYAQNMYCKCKIYNQELPYPRCGVGEIDYPKDFKLCHCIKDLPYPRAYPVKCSIIVKIVGSNGRLASGNYEETDDHRHDSNDDRDRGACVCVGEE